MGRIEAAVSNGGLLKNKRLEEITNYFAQNFDVTWGAIRDSYNTELTAFLIKPDRIFAETFGISYELLLVYSRFPEIQPRTMQAINGIFNSDPAKGRVETLVCVIVAEDPNAKEWVSKYTIDNQDLRTYVVFNAEQLLYDKKITSYINLFRAQLTERDLFDIQLPLLDDLYFFGREDLLHSIIDSVKKCENRGIFGLRKTGKTSLLYKIERTIRQGKIGQSFILDAKSETVQSRNWKQLLLYITKKVAEAYGNESSFNSNISESFEVVEQFETILKLVPTGERIVLMFDEIEYISYFQFEHEHWKEDYFIFWRQIWAIQSTCRNLCFIIAGVNPTVVEESTIFGKQNPLFSIIHSDYIRGLDREDVYEMSRKIGRRMGMKFDYEAVTYLHKRYGGHPLLTRLVLSYEYKNTVNKSITFTEEILKKTESARETELSPYCQHIVDVLAEFYEDEYILLEFLACGCVQDFLDLAPSSIITNHLQKYGMLEYKQGLPFIGIPVVGEYMRNCLATKSGKQLAKSIIPINDRKHWVANTVDSIINYMRQLESIIRKTKNDMLFGTNSFPNAEKLVAITFVSTERDFENFIKTLYLCFVEAIENYGKSMNISQYFWTVIKSKYPVLFDSLLRIKAYRNWTEHLVLNEEMQKTFDNFIYRDLEGKQFHMVKEGYFVLQQCVLEALKLAISSEISNLS